MERPQNLRCFSWQIELCLPAAYFPAPAEEATAVDTDTAVMSLRNSLVYLPADTIIIVLHCSCLCRHSKAR